MRAGIPCIHKFSVSERGVYAASLSLPLQLSPNSNLVDSFALKRPEGRAPTNGQLLDAPSGGPCLSELFGLPFSRGSPWALACAYLWNNVTGDIGQPRLSDRSRFEAACRGFDAANSLDPNLEIVDGIARPRELVYAERLTHWLLKLCPGASEELRLAARCQHICRWMIARGSYPMTRPGYLKWREDLKHFHAEKAGDILSAVGYPEESIAKVQALNLKKNFPQDPDSRVLEDALCLVFLEFQFAELSAKTTDEKMINALQKSWKKMTTSAREQAMRLNFGPKEKSLLERALAGVKSNA